MNLPPWIVTPARSALVGLVVVGLTACGSGEPRTDAEKLARGRELVQQMSARLAAAKAVTATTTEKRDAVRASGKKEQLSISGTYTMQRPNRFYVKMDGDRKLEAWYNGKVLTIAAHPEKVFAQAPMPDTIDSTLDALAERYDLPLPMGDLLYSSAEKALLSPTTKGGYAGTETVAGTECTHLAFQDTGVEWELWIPVQGEPLPKRFKVVRTKRTGQPVIDLAFASWDVAPQTTDATFTPKVPADYEGIAMLQKAAAVKKTQAEPAAPAPPARQ
jgi:hypothetical protein